MRIATFGSCLSRYTANSFVKLYGGEIVSSVYHNRSDAFVGKFIEKNWIIEDYASVKNLLKNDTQFENIDQKSSQILKN